MLKVENLFAGLVLAITSSLAFATPVNINTADAQAIAAATKGIGLKKAELIIAYRKQNGPFKTVEDLAQVKGIGAKTVEKNKENLTIGR